MLTDMEETLQGIAEADIHIRDLDAQIKALMREKVEAESRRRRLLRYAEAEGYSL